MFQKVFDVLERQDFMEIFQGLMKPSQQAVLKPGVKEDNSIGLTPSLFNQDENEEKR